jgi:putative restriction endonuclease
MTYDKSQILEKVQKLTVWRRHGERAPHKPLLLLLALGRLAHGCPRLGEYKDLAEPLLRLLRQYGPPRRSIHPESPFWRLQADGLWEITGDRKFKQRKGNSDPLKSELIRQNPLAGFTPETFDQLHNDRDLFEQTVHLLLNSHFPESMHEDLLRDVGIDFSIKKGGKRDSNFADGVLKAYGNVCAICGYDVRVGSAVLGIEAAHIKWCLAGGPNEIDNGLRSQAPP